jgi:hypothetical protein
MEHFKGYYHDGKLTIAPDDWVGATKGADIWLCPTFSTRMIGTEAETKAFLERPEDRYVSVSARRAWLRSSANDSGSVREKIAVMSDDIFRRLLPVTDRFIAGTDSGGGYRNLVPGFVLLEEIATFERLGMSPYDALRTATVNAARALLDEKEFGTVERGKRADLVLLDRDPRLSAANLRNPAGVMVRGTWLDRQTIRKMLDAVAAIYARGAADGSLDNPSDKQVDALRAGMQELAGNGWIFKDHQIAEAEALFKSRGRNAALRYNFSSK